jgi:hypothetical protein
MTTKARAVHYNTELDDLLAAMATARRVPSINKMIVLLLEEALTKPADKVDVTKLKEEFAREKVALELHFAGLLEEKMQEHRIGLEALRQELAAAEALAEGLRTRIEELSNEDVVKAKKIRELEAGRKILIANLAAAEARAKEALAAKPADAVLIHPELLQVAQQLATEWGKPLLYVLWRLLDDALQTYGKITETQFLTGRAAWPEQFLLPAQGDKTNGG